MFCLFDVFGFSYVGGIGMMVYICVGCNVIFYQLKPQNLSKIKKNIELEKKNRPIIDGYNTRPHSTCQPNTEMSRGRLSLTKLR